MLGNNNAIFVLDKYDSKGKILKKDFNYIKMQDNPS
jgi:hypothetical protein